MIKSFYDRLTAKLHAGLAPKGISREVAKMARARLIELDTVERLDDLAAHQGLRLEKLSGDRRGQHSIRVNQQFRICFIWRKGNAERVEFCDYH